MKVKVCGLRYYENVQAVCRLQPDYAGFIFYPHSPRFVGHDPDTRIFGIVPEGTRRVAVMVNETFEKAAGIIERYRFDAVQLHGNESPGMCKAMMNLGVEVIKALSSEKLADPGLVSEYSRVAHHLLIDTPTRAHGGSGRKFDWKVLEELPAGNSFFLSGGIGPSDADQIMNIEHPGLFAVDINSRFESEPGLKNITEVEAFIRHIRDEFRMSGKMKK